MTAQALTMDLRAVFLCRRGDVGIELPSRAFGHACFARFTGGDGAARRPYPLWSLLLFLLLLAGGLGAQEAANPSPDSFFIRSWQGQNGFPNNTIRAVTQTRDGYMWLGTDAGLVRFDGLHSQVFGLEEGLKNLQVSTLMEDSQGILWIGTYGGGVSRMEAGRLTSYSTRDGLAGDSVSCFLETTNGDIWIGTHTGLSSWHEGHFATLAKKVGPTLYYDLAKDSDGTIWAATVHDGLLHFQGKEYSNADWDPRLPKINVHNPRCTLLDSKNRLWVGLREREIWCRDQGAWTRYGTNDGFEFVTPYRLAETSDGNIWVGSLNEGLFYFQNGRFHNVRKKDGLSDNAVLSLYSGHDRFLWVGTQAGGLNRIGPKKIEVSHLMHEDTECQLRSLAQTTDGRLWVATFGQGIYRWQGEQSAQLPDWAFCDHLQAEAALAGRDGSFWWGATASVRQWKDGKMVYSYNEQWLNGDRAISLCEDREAGMWVGTYNGKAGLIKRQIVTPITGLSAKPITSLVQETDGTLWVGSLGGGLMRRQKDGKQTVFTTRDGLKSDLIRTLYLDAAGTLWIGTDGGGLSRWFKGRFDTFTTRQGLLDNIVLQILEDEDGSLWLGCNRGICRVSKRSLNSVASGQASAVYALPLGVPDGMPTEECVGNFGAALKTQDGQLCFSTKRGIVVIEPKRKSYQQGALPVVVLEDLRVDQTSMKTGAVLSDSLNGAGVPALAGSILGGRHHFEFRYAGINFDTPEKTRFRYRLDGTDSDWEAAGESCVAHFNFVAPGTHHFQVQACSLNEQWTRPGAEITFVVRPFWWQTAWFKTFSGLLCVGLIIGGVRWTERRRHLKRLERLRREQAMEQERIRIARDLHDELGSSLTYISMAITDLGQAQNASAGALTAKAEKISAFAVGTARTLDEIIWAINPRNDSLRSLLEYLTQYTREIFENTSIRCRFQIPENLSEAQLPPDLRHNLFLVVKEALNNALKYSQATEISLQARQDREQFEICLKDNGKGFNLAELPPTQQTKGLQNMRHRMESLGGRFTLETGPGQGTTLKLTMRLTHSDAANA